MAYFQKTIVRYERDPRAAEDADFYEKQCCPCFLGTDDKGDTHWYGYTFDDLISAKKVHEIFFFDSLNLPPKDSGCYYEPINRAKASMLQAGKDLVMNLMGLGLLPKTEKITICGKEETLEYCYVFEEFRFEHNVIKEVLGLDAADFKSLTEEQFEQMREKQNARWRKQNDLINGDFGDDFVSFKGLTHFGDQ